MKWEQNIFEHSRHLGNDVYSFTLEWKENRQYRSHIQHTAWNTLPDGCEVGCWSESIMTSTLVKMNAFNANFVCLSKIVCCWVRSFIPSEKKKKKLFVSQWCCNVNPPAFQTHTQRRRTEFVFYMNERTIEQNCISIKISIFLLFCFANIEIRNLLCVSNYCMTSQESRQSITCTKHTFQHQHIEMFFAFCMQTEAHTITFVETAWHEFKQRETVNVYCIHIFHEYAKIYGTFFFSFPSLSVLLQLLLFIDALLGTEEKKKTQN